MSALWMTRLACGHQEEFRSQPAVGSTVACPWPPCEGVGARREVLRAVLLQQGDEDRLTRGEAVPGARGACEREGCAHAKTRHCDPDSHSRRQGHCYAPGCRCTAWTSQVGEVMPPEPAMQEALW